MAREILKKDAVREIPQHIINRFNEIASSDAQPTSQNTKAGKAGKPDVSKVDGYSKADSKFKKSFAASGSAGGARFAGSASALLEKGGLKGASKAKLAASEVDKLDRVGRNALLALATRVAYAGEKDKLGFSTAGDE